jgi:membrane-bound lytic murein transglycosylase A
MLRAFIVLLLPVLLGSCATTPAEPRPTTRTTVIKRPAIITRPAIVTVPRVQGPSDFSTLPGWQQSRLVPTLNAFRRSCGLIEKKDDKSPLSDKAWWAGTAGDWKPACATMGVVADDASARTVLEALFVPVEINSPDGKSRFTGYFEPTYEARKRPIPPFTEPVPALPDDLVPSGANPKQRLSDGRTRPYPARAEITASGVKPIAYAHPSDVFFLQIQGSGRLSFPDGTTMRAAYAAHNGHPFKSTANWLIQNGKITRGEASMQGIRAWMDRAGSTEARRAMNYNPRFVFFQALPEGDSSLGPKGAQNVPLTPYGSMAVDTDIYPLGVPMFVQTTAPGLGGQWSGLMIAQDTGGAIKGPVRGDIYFGTGPDAGRRAGTMNAPGKLWVLLPRKVAERLAAANLADLGETPFAP